MTIKKLLDQIQSELKRVKIEMKFWKAELKREKTKFARERSDDYIQECGVRVLCCMAEINLLKRLTEKDK